MLCICQLTQSYVMVGSEDLFDSGPGADATVGIPEIKQQ